MAYLRARRPAFCLLPLPLLPGESASSSTAREAPFLPELRGAGAWGLEDSALSDLAGCPRLPGPPSPAAPFALACTPLLC